MATLLTEIRDPVPPTAEEARLAQESCRSLARVFARKRQKSLRIRIESEGESAESIAIPVSAFRLLNDILVEMAQGNAVTLVPVHAELTTRQAADMLHVSRPFLIQQLEQGLIPFRKVGTHRRVLFRDVLAYQQKMHQQSLQTLEELSAIDQELGLGY